MKMFLASALTLLPLMAYANLPTINFSTQSQIYKEGDVAVVTAELSELTVQGVTAELAIVTSESTATSADAVATNMFIRIAPGEQRGSISFKIIEDGETEQPETLTIRMKAAQNAILGQTNKIALQLVDAQEDSQLPKVNFSTLPLGAIEGSIVTVNATLDRPSNSLVHVPITLCGTAEYPSDHDLFTSEIVFEPQTTTATLSITIYQDHEVEDTEDIIIRMISPVANAELGSTTSHRIEVYDIGAKIKKIAPPKWSTCGPK